MAEGQLIKGGAPFVRFVQVDVLRGFAVLGIYWINIILFAVPAIDGQIHTDLNDDSLINSTLGIISEVYIEGTMRGLFSLLFGASALIFLDEARLATSGLDLVDRYYRRTLLLILFGLIHAYLLLWPHDVLYAYGLFGLFLFPMRKLSVRVLLICAIALLAIGDLNYSFTKPAGDPQATVSNVDIMEEREGRPINDADGRSSNPFSKSVTIETDPNPGVSEVTSEQRSWDDSNQKIQTEMLIDIYRSNYITIFNAQRKGVMEKQSITVYENYIFDIGGMMLLGMALFKLGALTGRFTSYIYLQLAVIGYVFGTLIRFAFAIDSPDPDPGYNIGRMLITLGHVGLIGLLCNSIRLKFFSRLLASVGRLALTNYIMQTVISIFLFYGIGFAFYAVLERYQLGMVCVGIWVFQIVFSNVWLIWFKHGPLEWLWRSMIYGNRQPILRSGIEGK